MEDRYPTIAKPDKILDLNILVEQLKMPIGARKETIGQETEENMASLSSSSASGAGAGYCAGCKGLQVVGFNPCTECNPPQAAVDSFFSMFRQMQVDVRELKKDHDELKDLRKDHDTLKKDHDKLKSLNVHLYRRLLMTALEQTISYLATSDNKIKFMDRVKNRNAVIQAISLIRSSAAKDGKVIGQSDQEIFDYLDGFRDIVVHDGDKVAHPVHITFDDVRDALELDNGGVISPDDDALLSLYVSARRALQQHMKVADFDVIDKAGNFETPYSAQQWAAAQARRGPKPAAPVIVAKP